MPGLTVSAPFPEDIPTHPLFIIDYALLRLHDERELDKLWIAATKLGFWYLKNHGVDDEVSQMFDMGAETLELPLEEKMKYEQGDTGYSFGYKARGTIMTDKNGTLDTVEFLNVAQDDALSWPQPTHRTYPDTVNVRMHDTIIPFVRKSMEVNKSLLSLFEELLGLQVGDLTTRHSERMVSGSEARCIKTPPNQSSAGIGAHTDFGSLSFLHNRLGGLQVMPPGSDKWLYIKPIPGHAVCNIGDALAILSGGILRSNVHRVMPPPGKQSHYERYSVVFFTRPADSTVLCPLSPLSKADTEFGPDASTGQFETGCTAGEWFSRRIRKLRINNRTGIESWSAALGTEHAGVER